MSRLLQPVLILALAVLLAACQVPGPGKSRAGEAGLTANAVTGGPIEVTPLDAAPGEGAAEAQPAGPDAAGADTAAPQGAAPMSTPAPAATAEPAAEAAAPEPAPKADLEEAPVAPKSERQRACERKRGIWSKVGKGDLRACVFNTRDGGKSCDRESDCEGVCLARSRSCAPLTPLFGCNEILQDNGARVTLCIE